MLSSTEARKVTVDYEANAGALLDKARLLKMKGGCANRDALESLGPEENDQRNMLIRIIGLEDPNLYHV